MAKNENTFLLLSLEEERAKKIANVINSDACRKILDFLARKDATETDISKELAIPISTVHYNLKQLVESGLAKADEFHYSEKGKEVNHYSIANKYIIIAPKTDEGIAAKLKKILPVAAVIGAGGIIAQFISSTGTFASNQLQEPAPTLYESAPMMQKSLVGVANKTAQESIAYAAASSAGTAANPILLFVLGAACALLLYLIYDVVRERLK